MVFEGFPPVGDVKKQIGMAKWDAENVFLDFL